MPLKRQCDESQPLEQFISAGGGADDMALVGRLLSNSESAWHELVTRYAGQIRARVSRVTRSCQTKDLHDCVDDILAEVFRALLANNYAALRAFQGRSSLSTYLCAIATRVALRQIGRSGSIANAGESLQQMMDVNGTSPDQRAISGEQRKRLLCKIDHLPHKQQQLIRLFHLEGKSYREISEQLCMPIGSIGPSLGRAESLLRQLLGEDFLS